MDEKIKRWTHTFTCNGVRLQITEPSQGILQFKEETARVRAVIADRLGVDASLLTWAASVEVQS